ncbi:hypothetical protein V6D40_06775 [Corynebacterium sp. Q4381]|uniref:hypothetical protein n=1 Tax=Corynebacterium sp. Marseille-Q4381 TaxID=3121597 RepID=UPI002FE5B360
MSSDRGLLTLLRRAVALDAGAVARVQAVGADASNVFVTTPFDCAAARRSTALEEGVFQGQLLIDALPNTPNPLPASAWPGALPPVDGFVLRDTVPIATVRKLADEGRALARQFSGPAGPPRSLLSNTVITADAESSNPVEVPMSMIFAATSLGLIPGFDAPANIPRQMRISTCGSWTRLDAAYGSIFRNAGLNLLIG